MNNIDRFVDSLDDKYIYWSIWRDGDWFFKGHYDDNKKYEIYNESLFDLLTQAEKFRQVWTFPAWEDMNPIDISKPLVTRGGEVVTAKHIQPIHPQQKWSIVVRFSDSSKEEYVTFRGQVDARVYDNYDVQNPPEWAYEQFGIKVVNQ